MTADGAPPDRCRVLEAAERIAGRVHKTPVFTSRSIDALLGARLFFKCENLQRSGSFKMRGATNAVRSLLAAGPPPAAVATHSSGNHGAALALAAGEAGLAATVVVPRDARTQKRRAIERYGARIVDCAPTLAARQATLDAVLAATGARFVPPYDDERIVCGAGTAALELLAQCPGLDQIWVPVGGGGLAAGTALAAGGQAEVVLAEPELARDAADSLASGELRPPLPPRTIADGLRTGLGRINFAVLREAGVGVVLASEQDIEEWTGRLAGILKVVVEPSAAVTVAAMAGAPGRARGRVGVVLSGGNL